MVNAVEEAKLRIYNIFQDEFPEHDFNQWNRDINDKVAKNIINSVGKATTINVRLFIERLW